MTDTQQVIRYWIEKAYQDIASAHDNLSGKRFQNAVPVSRIQDPGTKNHAI